MSCLLSERTPQIIAAEINNYKEQITKVRLMYAIEIGRRLQEAKELVPHGEWGKWLEETVDYSKRTATNLIRLFDEYNSWQLVSPNRQALADLSYTQGVILLDVPEENRAQFIAELDIDNISTRELKKAVNDLKQSQEEKDQAQQENAELQKALDEEKSENNQLKKERDDLKTKTDELQKSKQKLEQDVEKKKTENVKLKESSNIKSYQRVSNDLAAAQIKLATGKVAFRYETLDKAFKELTYELDLLAKIDPDVHTEYKKMLKDFLFKALKEKS